MRFSILLSLLATASFVSARSAQHVGKRMPDADFRTRMQLNKRNVAERAVIEERDTLEKRASPYLNAKSKKFVVDGSVGAIPDVDFDIGESYAGLLPISSKPKEKSELYFWFFPSENKLAGDEILIWLNGGPGCSSLEGFLQENGPFLWQYGTYKPVKNPYTWVNLTNMVWVEQPVGTGFSQGTPTATSEADVAKQFLGFWKNFVDTFNLHGKKIFIAGESYAGYYVPYIADAMFNKKDKNYYNMDSILIYDPSLSSTAVQEQIPAVPFVNYWGPLLDLNDTFVANITARAASCGYTKYIDEYLAFPPKGPLPSPPDVGGTDDDPNCDLWDDIYYAASSINPCFDIYQVATTCPLLWDVLGFPGSFDYEPDGANIYFNRTAVQKAINAPLTDWAECTNTNVFVNGTDNSQPSALSVLPSVIERTNRTIIGHGLLDFILMYNGTLLAIQNMTWSGAQGFSSPPKADFFVPYHVEASLGTIAGAGVMGKTHTERGLTLVTVTLSGHMIPQYAPSAAYRQVEYLLGRIDSLSEISPFTTQPKVAQPPQRGA